MKLSEFKNKNRICILGFGVEGKAVLELLRYFYPDKEYVIVDKNDGDKYLEKINGCDLIIKSPGIKGSELNFSYTTPTNVFFANAKGMKIGVTGTKGKSTTANLTYSILKKAGKKVFLVGNIGHSMPEALLDYCKLEKIKKVEELESFEDDVIYVCELSSYQLSDIEYSPDISLINNLNSDHMDYHGGVQAYRDAKKNIVKHVEEGDIFIYNQDFEELKELANSLKIDSIPFLEDDFLIEIKGKTLLVGDHNFDNMRAAATVANYLGIEEEMISSAIKETKTLKNRLELVGEFNNIIFYSDAISTTPESTIVAIDALENVDTIFLGGFDRGYNFKDLGNTISNSSIKNIVLFPETGEKILTFLNENDFNILRTEIMEEAVKFAYKKTRKGGICLLSTASPSFGLWKNFKEKGSEFVKYIKELARKDS